MKMHVLAVPAIVALALASPLSNQAGAAVDREHAIVIPGTVVSSDSGNLILRTDDHGHRMAFERRARDLRAGHSAQGRPRECDLSSARAHGSGGR